VARSLLTLDVGNTETVIGLFAGSELRHHWRIATDRRKTPDELALVLRSLLADAEFDLPLAGVIGSVVPPIDPVITRAFRRAFDREPRLIDGPRPVLDATSPPPIRLEVDDPAGVGADRVLNTLAVSRLYEVDTIAVDLGTATTFDCIAGDGTFLGGVIAPGPRSGIEGLAARATKLPFVDLIPPDRVIGKRTETCLRAGCFYSIVDAIDGIVRRIKGEWERPDALVVATGGLAGLIGPCCETVQRVEPYLTLYGLEIADRLMEERAAAADG
jgi:type III pantothenate kinase